LSLNLLKNIWAKHFLTSLALVKQVVQLRNLGGGQGKWKQKTFFH